MSKIFGFIAGTIFGALMFALTLEEAPRRLRTWATALEQANNDREFRLVEAALDEYEARKAADGD